MEKRREMEEPTKYNAPTPGTGDIAHTIARAGLSSIPFVGGAAVELFTALLAPPLERRRQQWMEEVADALRQLEAQQGLDLNSLQSNEAFISVLTQASQAAVRTHQDTKVQALHNAVCSAATQIEIEESLQLLFIRYIDELTPLHLTLLKFFLDNQDGVAQAQSYDQLFQQFVEQHSTSDVQRDVFRLLCEDLSSRVLVRISSSVDDFNDIYHAGYLIDHTSPNVPTVRVTEVGEQLLRFVTQPR